MKIDFSSFFWGNKNFESNNNVNRTIIHVQHEVVFFKEIGFFVPGVRLQWAVNEKVIPFFNYLWLKNNYWGDDIAVDCDSLLNFTCRFKEKHSPREKAQLFGFFLTSSCSSSHTDVRGFCGFSRTLVEMWRKPTWSSSGSGCV